MENPTTDKKSQLLYWILGGGVGCSILGICLIGAIVIGAMAIFGDPQPSKFVGTWKGRFDLNGGPNDIVYILNKDGTFRQESYTLEGRKHYETHGRWGVRGSEMKISFDGGDVERAAIAWIDDNTFTYRITDQSRKDQIGLTTTFKRQ